MVEADIEATRIVLGIDFGSSSTVAALAGVGDRIRSLTFDGSPLLPSAVFAGPGAGLLVGGDAQRASVGHPAGYEATPKRRVDDGAVLLGDRELPVTELIAAVLARVVAEATRVAGRAPDQVVLTHPAAWGRARLATLATAAAHAGLGPVTLVPEPVAAAAYFATTLGPAGNLLVYDLGAGTFDVALVRRTAGGFGVVASDGLPDVGGLDLDAAVMEHARSHTPGPATDGAWRRLDRPGTEADRLGHQTVWLSARAVKEQLSRHPSGDLYLPLVDRRLHMTRDEFETLARPLLDRTVESTLGVLRDAGLTLGDVGAVFLVGGSSRIPLVATLLHRALGVAPTVIDQPELVVAEGALHAGSPAAGTDGGATGALTGSPGAGLPATAGRIDRRRALALASAGVLFAAGGGALAAATRPWARAHGAERTLPVRAVEPIGGPLTGHTREIYGVSFSPDGRTFATASVDNTVRLWETATGRVIATFTGHDDYVNDVAFSPDGRILATAGNDRTVRRWDLATLRSIDILTGHTDRVYDVAFSPDGGTLASAGQDRTVRLWNPATGTDLGAFTGHAGEVTKIAFSPDGGVLAAAGATSLDLWDATTRQPVGDRLGDPAGIAKVAFSPDGSTLATAAHDNDVRRWNVADRRPVGDVLGGHIGRVYDVAFAPDGTILATAGADTTVRLWDLTGRHPTARVVAGHPDQVFGVAFSPDATILATAGADTAVRLWRLIR